MTLRDEDGAAIKSGDHITFTFGIPPVRVVAQVGATGDELWITCLTPEDVKPKRERLKNVMKWYQVWRIAAWNRRTPAPAEEKKDE